MSRVLDWADRGTCILFGDGAGAVVLRHSEEPGRELVLWVISIERLVDLDKNLLRQIMGISLIMEQAKEKIDQSSLIALDEFTELLLVAVQNGRNQLYVRRLRRFLRHCSLRYR